MHTAEKTIKTNEQMTEQVARITSKLMKRTAKLNLPPGASVSTNQLAESSVLTAHTTVEPGVSADVHSVDVPNTRYGAPLAELSHDKGFKTSKQHVEMVNSIITGEDVPRVLSTTSVKTVRDGRYGPMTTVHSQETATGSWLGPNEHSKVAYDAAYQPANPQNIHAAAESLSAIRGQIAAAEIAQQQAAQAQIEQSQPHVG